MWILYDNPNLFYAFTARQYEPKLSNETDIMDYNMNPNTNEDNPDLLPYNPTKK